ncbi:MAG: class II glutamine amidotransferase [Pseudorhodobacter sp.]|nr:class II glutamine amidotransferase [Pseudorhodobacter sp.]
MCELFAMSASEPTDVNHSLALLRPRGGAIGPHADGWGVAFYEDRAARIFKEPVPAAESRCLAFISEYDFKSETVIAHIRKANPERFGRTSANTHPFEREWNGQSWVFAHNGKLPGLAARHEGAPRRFQPLGDTDSELAFCLMLDAIAAEGAPAPGKLTAVEIIARIAPIVARLATLGEFNFFLSDGESLIVHAHTRLHLLARACTSCAGQVRVILLATLPLTDEPWVPLPPGSLHAYTGGREIALPTPVSPTVEPHRALPATPAFASTPHGEQP